ncbi:MAG: DNA topoisomerase 1 [Syntrophorhabdaceae bacterium PtaU1.Bin034]|nr:MAG: DNA topoisomerase 1 [Syntrophorhabdaceae bacterium PtaU1.Bin034]
MAKSLLVVESPTKMKTLSKFLGKDYVIRATYGHIKDLPKSKMGVDIDHGFKPQFTVVKGKAKIVDEIKKASKDADNIYIGSDPDREGEAIAFHVAEEIGNGTPIQRVLFNEITKKAVLDAIKSPRKLDESKYDAQKARRILDRLVGYELSPLLWERVKYGLSAGRVQSVALKLVCEREDEIEAFVKEEYWTIEAEFRLAGGEIVKAKLEKINGKKPQISSKQQAERIRKEIEGKTFTVAAVEEKERYASPYPPFKTSTLQQDASSKLRFSPKKTMLVAQKLFEGVEIGKAMTGLITYMRTDSVRISSEALNAVRKLIGAEFGPTYVPGKPNMFSNSKTAQDAHEAIRPTDVKLTPEKMKQYLDKDMLALYELIWKRFVASQMAREKMLIRTAEITANGYTFVAKGSKVLFDGFSKLYEADKREEERVFLPDMQKGEIIDLSRIAASQHFTSPPPRYSEASLIKTLEAKGIGRPSTYATTVSTIQERGYVHKEKGSLVVVPLGRTVNRLLTEFFPKVIDVDFTAKLEDGLDLIEEEEKNWVASLSEFYGVFQEELGTAKERMKNLKKEEKETSIKCEKCGKNMILRWGKNGEYLVCSGRPACKNKKNVRLDKDGNINIVEETSVGVCPQCGGNLVEKTGRFGRFIACSNYPDCKYTKPYTMGFHCPVEGCTGDLVERVSKKRKKFFGCSRYPDCTFATSLQPKEGQCPTCGAPVLFAFRGKLSCQRKDCGWKSA